jgi:hypothetical protein
MRSDTTWSALITAALTYALAQVDNEQGNDTNDTNTTENALPHNDIPHAWSLH